MIFASKKKWIIWGLAAILFFAFIEIDYVPATNHDKVRIRTRQGGNGIVLRLKWGVWELWQLKHMAEIKKLFPLPHYDPVQKLERYAR